MRCQACGDSKLVTKVQDMPYTYRGEATVIPSVSGSYCASCEEFVLDGAESARVSAMMMAFNKRVNAVAVDPEFIVSVRKKLALDQREAGEIFGGGVNAFSRYENGKTKPPVSLVKLLKILEKHPDLLNEIRAA